MKILVGGLMAVLLIAAAGGADAVVCARGAYHAGCAGPNGAVVAHRPAAGAVVVHPAPVVVAPARHCVYRNGVRVCG